MGSGRRHSRRRAVGVLLAVFVFEVFLNGFFLAKGSELGYLGGAVEAFTFALLNVGGSFLIAVAGVRELNHRNLFRKLFGLLSLLCYVALALGLNLALAHYREASGSLVSDAGREVLLRLQASPLAIADVKSWLFFGLGILCSLIAFADAFLIFDPYPGYGTLEKRRTEAHEAYIRQKSDLVAKLLEIRNQAIEILEENLLEFRGALVLVTHDRYMLDRVSTTVLGLDGWGCAERFADYSQWETWQQERIQITKEATTRKPPKAAASSSSPAKKKLSYLEAREYAGIEQRIAEAEDMVKTRREAAEDPAITSDAGRLLQAYHELEEARKTLDSLYERWHDLEEKQR